MTNQIPSVGSHPESDGFYTRHKLQMLCFGDALLHKENNKGSRDEAHGKYDTDGVQYADTHLSPV